MQPRDRRQTIAPLPSQGSRFPGNSKETEGPRPTPHSARNTPSGKDPQHSPALPYPTLPYPPEGVERQAPTSPLRNTPAGPASPPRGQRLFSAQPRLTSLYPAPPAPEQFPGCTRLPEGHRAAAHGEEEGTGWARRGRN